MAGASPGITGTGAALELLEEKDGFEGEVLLAAGGDGRLVGRGGAGAGLGVSTSSR